jgi:hypothetical protein
MKLIIIIVILMTLIQGCSQEITIESTEIPEKVESIVEEEIIELEEPLKDLVAPSLSFSDISSTPNSIMFDLISEKNDVEDLEIVSIELFLNNQLVESFDDEIREINDLFSNNTYEVVVYYSYSFDDGEIKNETISTMISTEELRPPILTIDFIELTNNSVSFDFMSVSSDVDYLINSMVLNDGLSSDVELDGSIRNLVNLNANQQYKLFVNYEFDLNDSKGIVQRVEEFTFETQRFSGAGTQDDPYKIYNSIEFNWISELDLRDNPLYFKLHNDINFRGNPVNPIIHFEGQFDGGGYSLSNITFSNEDLSLFSYSLANNNQGIGSPFDIQIGMILNNYGVIENLNLNSVRYNFELNSASVTPIFSYEIGGIVARNHTDGIIRNINAGIYIIDIGDKMNRIGGIVSTNLGKVEEIYVFGYLSGGNSLGGISSGNFGSLTDLNINIEIENDYNKSQVPIFYFMDVPISIGGVSGINAGIIEKAIVNSPITSISDAYRSAVGGVSNSSYRISDVIVQSNIKASSSDAVVYLGGITGQLYQGTLTNGIMFGSIEGTSVFNKLYIGDITGYLHSDTELIGSLGSLSGRTFSSGGTSWQNGVTGQKTSSANIARTFTTLGGRDGILLSSSALFTEEFYIESLRLDPLVWDLSQVSTTGRPALNTSK